MRFAARPRVRELLGASGRPLRFTNRASGESGRHWTRDGRTKRRQPLRAASAGLAATYPATCATAALWRSARLAATTTAPTAVRRPTGLAATSCAATAVRCSAALWRSSALRRRAWRLPAVRLSALRIPAPAEHQRLRDRSTDLRDSPRGRALPWRHPWYRVRQHRLAALRAQRRAWPGVSDHGHRRRRPGDRLLGHRGDRDRGRRSLGQHRLRARRDHLLSGSA